MIRFSHHRSTGESLREYGRGIAGGLIFSLPLLYTMEVWLSGDTLHPGRIMLYVAMTFALLLLYNRFAGLRRDASMLEVAIDSVEELGIGLIVSAAVLWLTDRIHLGMPAGEILGKWVMEAMTVAIGVSVGTAQLGASDEGDEGFSGDDDEGPSYLPQVAIGFCSAVLFAANVAPTDEIMVIAQEASAGKLLGITLASIGIAWLILHFSDFQGADRYVASGTLVHSVRGVITTYAVSLAASVALLWFFGKLDGEPVSLMVAKTVVMAFPAVLGASAGRLLLQANGSGSGSKSSSS